jgi:hypothetical protein
VSGQLHVPAALPPGDRAHGTHWIGGLVGPRAGLDDVQKRKFLTLPGLEFRLLCRPARSQSLYQLRYSCSIRFAVTEEFIFSAISSLLLVAGPLFPEGKTARVQNWPLTFVYCRCWSVLSTIYAPSRVRSYVQRYLYFCLVTRIWPQLLSAFSEAGSDLSRTANLLCSRNKSSDRISYPEKRNPFMGDSKDYKTSIITESEWAPKMTFDKQNNFGPANTKQSYSFLSLDLDYYC